MKEFGSDFHSINSFDSGRAHLTDIYSDALFFADGRMCLISLIEHNGWKRIWMPEYFCYEVIETLKQQSGIEIRFYRDFPGCDDSAELDKIDFREGDVLFRVNYFGMRTFRSEKVVPVPVIEDHTHDLLGRWALYSDADWCIASLRKTLPIAEGGMMWSPKRHNLQMYSVQSLGENDEISAQRWKAMDLKASYLKGENDDKDTFRQMYVQTEEWFDTASVSGIDERSMKVIRTLDINSWYDAKRKNLNALNTVFENGIKAEDESCNLFSFVLLSDNRQAVRKKLIDDKVYSAILWSVPENSSSQVRKFSESMMSIHCDGRYSADDMAEIATRINRAK